MIKSNMKEVYFNIVFADELKGDVCGDLTRFPFAPVRIRIKSSYMESDSNPLCCPMQSTIGHELIHAWYPLEGDDTSECKTYRIERECFHCKDAGRNKNCDKDNVYKSWAKDHDNPDDNYSFSSGNISNEFIADSYTATDITGNSKDFEVYYSEPDVQIYNKYNADQKEWLIKKFEGDNYLTTSLPAGFFIFDKILVLPTGELMEDYQSELFKAALERFVQNGGTLLVFAQQIRHPYR